MASAVSSVSTSIRQLVWRVVCVREDTALFLTLTVVPEAVTVQAVVSVPDDTAVLVMFDERVPIVTVPALLTMATLNKSLTHWKFDPSSA
jgi:fumarate reductase subunit C